MKQWIVESTAWMYWTVPSALAFTGLLAVLIGMNLWEWVSPNISRKGFLPIKTSRGDRLFICIMAAIGIHFLWIGLFGDRFLAVPLSLSLAACLVIARWG